jgi:hypothetical protein
MIYFNACNVDRAERMEKHFYPMIKEARRLHEQTKLTFDTEVIPTKMKSTVKSEQKRRLPACNISA